MARKITLGLKYERRLEGNDIYVRFEQDRKGLLVTMSSNEVFRFPCYIESSLPRVEIEESRIITSLDYIHLGFVSFPQQFIKGWNVQRVLDDLVTENDGKLDLSNLAKQGARLFETVFHIGKLIEGQK